MSEQSTERIEKVLKTLSEQVSGLDERFVKLDEKIDTEVRRWDERFFQLARDNQSTSRNVIVAAASVVIFGSVVRAVPDILEAIALLTAPR